MTGRVPRQFCQWKKGPFMPGNQASGVKGRRLGAKGRYTRSCWFVGVETGGFHWGDVGVYEGYFGARFRRAHSRT